MERIKELKGTLDNSGVLSKSDKEYIKAKYFEIFNRELLVKTKCSDCWNDALIELIATTREIKITLKGGALVYYNDKLYTRLNITDEIANIIMAEQPDTKSLFYVM